MVCACVLACVRVVSRRDQMRAARSVESLDQTGRPGPHTDVARSFDDQQLHDALSEQRVGPGPPASRRQAPGQYTSCVAIRSFAFYNSHT